MHSNRLTRSGGQSGSEMTDPRLSRSDTTKRPTESTISGIDSLCFSTCWTGQGIDAARVSKEKKPRSFLLLLLAGLAVGYLILNPAEPSYQGRSASAWLDDLASSKSDEERAALKAMGSNAVLRSSKAQRICVTLAKQMPGSFEPPKSPCRWQILPASAKFEKSRRYLFRQGDADSLSLRTIEGTALEPIAFRLHVLRHF